MKKLLLITAGFLFLFNNVSAQLVADAGPDQFACEIGGANLGGSPTASGGTAPYTYSWSPGYYLADSTAANPLFNTPAPALPSYMFYLTVTDSVGAQAFDSVLITINSQPVVNATVSDTLVCAGTTVTLGAAVTVGTPPYTYDWQFFSDTTILIPGSQASNPQISLNYNANVYALLHLYDANGCDDTSEIWFHVRAGCGPFSIFNTNATCFGACNGSSTVNPQGNYRYSWSNGDTTATASGLCAGTYHVTVMDSVLNPLITLHPQILQPTQIVLSVTTNSATCFGQSNGAIVLTVSGGSGPYTYLWSNGSTTVVQQGLAAGIYTVTVVDNNGCSATINGVVAQAPAIAVAVNTTNETASGACNGSASAVITGGNPPYTYQWSNTATVQTMNTLCPGTYAVTVTDANGCTATAWGIVNSFCPSNTLVVSISSTGDLDCTHSADTVTAVVSGGTLPYYYWWTNGSSDTSTIVNQAGVFDLWVTDSSGCNQVAHDTVQNLGVVVTLQSATPVACNGVSNGKIKVSVSGGVPPYTFLWSNGATADSIINVAYGTYTLTVTDAASCSATFSYFLNQVNTNWSYYVYVTSTSANCGNNGTATANVYGGTSPFTYLWNTVPAQTTPTATGLVSGTYTVTVTGNDGCIRTGSRSVYTTCYNIIQGYVFNDTNGNCVKDAGETVIPNQSVYATGTGSYYGYSDASGYYKIQIPISGGFVVTSSSNNGWGNCSALVSCGAQTANFTGTGDTTNLNFGFGGSPGYNLSIHPGWTSANPGFTKDYWVLYNQNSYPLYNGPAVITFTYDAVLQFQSCTQGCVHNSANHTVTWNLASVPAYWVSWNSRPIATFLVPANTPLSYQLHADFVITPTSGDCYLADNYLSRIEPITGSQDPNEKEVLPAGDIIEEDSVLTYTIHFQNTGNDTTWFIIVKDTLSPNLNAASVQNISSSHEYSSFDISDNGILTWVFNPIFLVDSNTNEAASKGYVMFKVKKKPNLPLTTVISNKAHIYFDYNEPVVTNTVTNTITFAVSIFNSTSDNDIAVTAMPNPFTHSTQIVVGGISTAYDFELFDVTGKALKKISSLTENHFELNRDDLSAGVYLYRVTTAEKKRAFGRVVVQ